MPLATTVAMLGVMVGAGGMPVQTPFLCGGDVSEIAEVEMEGTPYLFQGKEKDPFAAMKQHGWNLVRFRVWNDPKDGFCDKAHTLALAKRAHDQGLAISIDFHYSDWWADPGNQTKPAAWKDLPFDKLVDAVHDTTKEVVGALKAQGTPPIMVQVGNEISPGMLWPDGKNDSPEGWERLGKLVNSGCKAVKEVDPAIQTMLHIDKGGDNKGSQWWFDNILKQGVSFDLIGLSYYPWWHGSLDDFKSNLDDLAHRYQKDIVVVETAYPWREGKGLTDGKKLVPGFPATPKGQADFIAKLREIVRDVPDRRGRGVLYWAPTWIGPKGRAGGYENLALFDDDGEALPGFTALGALPGKL